MSIVHVYSILNNTFLFLNFDYNGDLLRNQKNHLKFLYDPVCYL